MLQGTLRPGSDLFYKRSCVKIKLPVNLEVAQTVVDGEWHNGIVCSGSPESVYRTAAQKTAADIGMRVIRSQYAQCIRILMTQVGPPFAFRLHFSPMKLMVYVSADDALCDTAPESC